MLEAIDLSVIRGGRAALRGVSLTLCAGEVMAVCGPNGAGKSTLLSALAGDLKPDGGAVLLGGAPIAAMSPRALARRRAVMEQDPALSAPFRVRDLAALGLSAMPEIPPDAAGGIVARAMAQAGIAAHADRPADRLSGGERARAHLARALAQLEGGRQVSGGAPGALLLDEPTASLDLARQAEAMGAARAAAQGGAAVLAILHDLNLAAAFADRVALLRAGRLEALAPVAEAMTSARLSDVYGAPVEVRPAANGGLSVAPVFAPPPAPPPGAAPCAPAPGNAAETAAGAGPGAP